MIGMDMCRRRWSIYGKQIIMGALYVCLGRNLCSSYGCRRSRCVHIKCRMPNSQPFSICSFESAITVAVAAPKSAIRCGSHPRPVPPLFHFRFARFHFHFAPKKHEIRVNTQFIAFRKAIRVSNKTNEQTNEILMKIYNKNIFVLPHCRFSFFSFA